VFCLLQASSGNFTASDVLEKLEDITKGDDSQTGDLLTISSTLEHVVNGINISDVSTNVKQVTHVCISYEFNCQHVTCIMPKYYFLHIRIKLA